MIKRLAENQSRSRNFVTDTFNTEIVSSPLESVILFEGKFIVLIVCLSCFSVIGFLYLDAVKRKKAVRKMFAVFQLIKIARVNCTLQK